MSNKCKHCRGEGCIYCGDTGVDFDAVDKKYWCMRARNQATGDGQSVMLLLCRRTDTDATIPMERFIAHFGADNANYADFLPWRQFIGSPLVPEPVKDMVQGDFLPPAYEFSLEVYMNL